MRLTPKLKKQIDDYFESMSAEEILNLAVDDYRFTEVDIVNEVWIVDRLTYKKLQCLGRFKTDREASIIFSKFPRNTSGEFCIDIRYCEYVDGKIIDEHCSCRRPI